jgi:hypothetical protein
VDSADNDYAIEYLYRVRTRISQISGIVEQSLSRRQKVNNNYDSIRSLKRNGTKKRGRRRDMKRGKAEANKERLSWD